MLNIDISGEELDRGTIEQLIELLGKEEITVRSNGYIIKRITTDDADINNDISN